MTKRAYFNENVKYDENSQKILVLEKENLELITSCDKLAQQMTLVARKNREYINENRVLKSKLEQSKGKSTVRRSQYSLEENY